MIKVILHFTRNLDDMSSFVKPVVRVGVGAFVRSSSHPQCVLVGKRKGSHGAGMLALPGGHLEIGETWEECAVRETKEETDLDCTAIGFNAVTNDRSIDDNPSKHYITIFMNIEVNPTSAPLTNVEPHKCEGWEWIHFDDLTEMHRANPGLLFDPLARFIDEGHSAFPTPNL